VAAAGWDLANWGTVGQIAASWVVSPLFGGVMAAIFLYIVKRTITYQADLMQASRRMVPVLLGVMGLAFAAYLALKGLNQLVKVSFVQALTAGAVVGLLTFFYTRMRVRQR